MLFKDRIDAGKQLAEKLKDHVGPDGIALAIPRGGVIVGAEIARRLGLGFDLQEVKDNPFPRLLFGKGALLFCLCSRGEGKV